MNTPFRWILTTLVNTPSNKPSQKHRILDALFLWFACSEFYLFFLKDSGELSGKISGELSGELSGALSGKLSGTVGGTLSGSLIGELSGALSNALRGALSFAISGALSDALSLEVSLSVAHFSGKPPTIHDSLVGCRGHVFYEAENRG